MRISILIQWDRRGIDGLEVKNVNNCLLFYKILSATNIVILDGVIAPTRDSALLTFHGMIILSQAIIHVYHAWTTSSTSIAKRNIILSLSHALSANAVLVGHGQRHETLTHASFRSYHKAFDNETTKLLVAAYAAIEGIG